MCALVICIPIYNTVYHLPARLACELFCAIMTKVKISSNFYMRRSEKVYNSAFVASVEKDEHGKAHTP